MPKKLLIADDSITIQKVMTITFPTKDYELLIVGNGDDAIKKSKEFKPDLVICDIGMPGKSGYEVCEVIKKNPELKNVPVLLLSGAFEPFDVNRAKTVGADDYIVKPFETQSLINKVNELLSRIPPKETVEEKSSVEKIEESFDIELGEIVEEEAPPEAVEAAVVEETAPVEAAEIVEEAEEVQSATKDRGEETAPEDLWSMEGFEGVDERREEERIEEAAPLEIREEAESIEPPVVEGVQAQMEVQEVTPIAEEVTTQYQEEVQETITLESEEGIIEEAVQEESIAEVESPGIEVEKVVSTVEEAEEIEEAELVQESRAVKEIISWEQISEEIERKVTSVLSRLLPRLVEKITEEIIGSIARGFVRDAIEKSNLNEITRRMIEEELKKS